MSKERAHELMQSVNKALGTDALKLGSDKKFSVGYLRTNLLPVDILLQGGIPFGRFTVLQGDWSTLKSYIGLHAIAAAQREGKSCAIVDTEHAYDEQWARECGVDTDSLIVLHPENGELAIDAAEVLIRGGVDLIVFDSVAATLPQAEADKRMYKENVQPGRQAALMSLACRRLTTANSHTAVIWINQYRENIGVTFGPREKAAGGRALPYYASVIVEMRKAGKITRSEKRYTGDKWQDSKLQIGQKFVMTTLKSKLNAPFREVWFDYDLENGRIDLVGFLIAQGLESGIITLKGNTWSYKSHKAVGREKFKALVNDNAKLASEIEADVMALHYKKPKTAEVTSKRSPAKKANSKKTPARATTKKRIAKR